MNTPTQGSSISSSAARAARWQGPTGLVDALVEETLAPDLARFEFYFAGPPPMAEAMQTDACSGIAWRRRTSISIGFSKRARAGREPVRSTGLAPQVFR